MPESTAPTQGDGIKAEQLSAVLPMTAKIDDSDIHEKHLWVGGVNTSKLPKSESSPLFIYDRAHIEAKLAEYMQGMAGQFERSRVAYAAKAFVCTEMCRLVEASGASLLVCSGGELAIAQAAGFPMSRVVMHGNAKSDAEIQEALMAGVGLIIIDNIEEIGRIDLMADLFDVKPNVMLRVRSGVHADTHSYIQTAQEDSKFGTSISNGEALDAAKLILESSNLHLTGIMCHIGSQIFNLDCYDATIDVLVGFACRLRDELGYACEEIDLGGGLGIAYTKDDEPTSISTFCERIGAKMASACEAAGLPMPLVAVEPGRSIVGNAGITCYHAVAIKDIPGIRSYVVVDGGMGDNIRPALYGAKYEAIIANKGFYPRTNVYTIAGKNCESGDILVRDASLQPVEEGDIVAVLATGAYCYSMSSNYNSLCKPAVAFVADGKYRIVVRAQTYDDLLACDECAG